MMNSTMLLRDVIFGLLSERILKTSPGLSRNSVDEQIDALLINYEKNSIGKDTFELDVNEAVDDKESELDLVRFSNKLSRLVQNYDSVLDVETVILFRAVKHVEENYGKATASELMNRLSEIHGIHVSKKFAPSHHKPPNAVGAEGIPSAG